MCDTFFIFYLTYVRYLVVCGVVDAESDSCNQSIFNGCEKQTSVLCGSEKLNFGFDFFKPDRWTANPPAE